MLKTPLFEGTLLSPIKVRARALKETNVGGLLLGELVYTTDTEKLLVGGQTGILQIYPQNFLQLTDTPSGYTNFAGYYLIVNETESGIDFVPNPAGDSMLWALILP